MYVSYRQKPFLRIFNDSNQKNHNNYYKESIPCSIKPDSLIIPKDVNVRNIFLNMIRLSKFQEFSNFYKQLSKKEKSKRLNLLETIKYFIEKHKIKNSIFLNTIFLFDILIKKNNSNLDLQQLSLGALILSIKFNNESTYNLTNNNFKYFGETEYSSEELAEIELTCLLILNHKLNYIQPINFLELFFLNGIVFITDKILTEDSTLVYSCSLILLEELMKMNNAYMKFNPFNISCSIVALCRHKFNLEIWPDFLGIIFKINLYDFEETLDFVRESFKNFQIKFEYYNNNSENLNKKKNVRNESFSPSHSNTNNINNLEKSQEKYYFTQGNVSMNNSINQENENKFFSPTNLKKPLNFNYMRSVPRKHNKSLYNSERKEDSLFHSDKKGTEIKIFYNKENRKENTLNYNKNNNKISLFKYNPKYFKDENKTTFFNTNLINPKTHVKMKSLFIDSHNKNNFLFKNDFNNLNYDKYKITHVKRKTTLGNYLNLNENNFPQNFMEKRIRNLSQVVNHLYSNHTNNIL